MRASAAAVTVALVAAIAPASQASLQLPPGVHVDPNSPAGKQYAIPIPAARPGAQAA